MELPSSSSNRNWSPHIRVYLCGVFKGPREGICGGPWWAISGWLHASNWWLVWIIARQMPIPDMSWYVQNYRSRSFWFKVIMKIVAIQHVPSIPSPQTIGSMMIWSSKKHRSFWGPGTLSPRFRLVTSRCWKIIWSNMWIRQVQFFINKPLNKAWICHGFAMFCPRLETFVYNSELY